MEPGHGSDMQPRTPLLDTNSNITDPIPINPDGQLVLPSGFSAAELHVHTTHSDGIYTPKKNIALAKSRNLAVIAITDHDMINAALGVTQMAQHQGIEAIVGQEITTKSQRHILGLFLRAAVPIFKTVPETVARIRDQGGLAIIAHPFLPFPGSTSAHEILGWLEETTFDGIEVENQYLSESRRLHLREFYEQYSRNIGAAIGGTDAHYGDVGRIATLFPGRTAKDLRAAIENRTTVAKQTLVKYDKPTIGDRFRNQQRSLLYLPYYRLRAWITGRYL